MINCEKEEGKLFIIILHPVTVSALSENYLFVVVVVVSAFPKPNNGV